MRQTKEDNSVPAPVLNWNVSQDVPQQKNGSDCGVFAIKVLQHHYYYHNCYLLQMALCIAFDNEPNFSQVLYFLSISQVFHSLCRQICQDLEMKWFMKF